MKKKLMLYALVVYFGTMASGCDDKINTDIGRFQLQPTSNIWNFLLLDTTDGRLWQCQYTVGDSKKETFSGCISLDTEPKAIPKISLWEKVKNKIYTPE